MDFSTYTGSKMILDQSGLQPIGFLVNDCVINFTGFWTIHNIKVVTTQESARELTCQPYKQDLFGGQYNNNSSVTASDLNNNHNYVLSRTNLSLTTKSLDLYGYPVEIVSISKEFQTSNTSLWNDTIPFNRIDRKIEIKNRGYADKSNLKFARNLQLKKENFFLCINDNDQIKQSRDFEGFKYLRPTHFLVWMVFDGYIKRQKAVWAYEKMRKKDPRWVKRGENFKDIFKKLKK